MKPITTGLDNVVTAMETPTRELRPRKLTLPVSGARFGSVARPAADLATGVAMAGAVAAPRFGMRVHRSPLTPVIAGPMSPDDYATAEDYE
jgi:hypothetical protein